MKPEQWKSVVGWPNYEVSDLGNVRGRHGLITTFPIYGYPSFNVVAGGSRRRSLRVHVEVLRSFIGERPAGLVIRHLNGSKADCRLENLAYGTSKQNEADKVAHGTKQYGQRHCCAKISNADAEYIKRSTEKLDVLVERFGLTKSQVCAIRKGRAWRWLQCA